MIIIAILAFIFGLGIIVLIHELGHFIFAKRAGILCYEFSIGFGPAIYRKKKGETIYAIKCLPIGGYVSMAGEEVSSNIVVADQKIGLNLTDGLVSEIIVDPNEEAEVSGTVISSDLYDDKGNGLYIQLMVDGEEKTYQVMADASYVMPSKNTRDRQWRKMQIATYDRSFESKKLLPRFLAISFGPIMNLLLAIVLNIIVGLCIGKADVSKTVLAEVSGPAAMVDTTTQKSILMKNDEIISIEGYTVTNWNELSDRLDEIVGQTSIDMVINRNGSQMNVTVNPMIMIGNFGVYGYGSDDASNGVPVYLYVTNAKKAGILDGDLVKKIDGIDVSSWTDIVNICNSIDGKTVSVVIDRPTIVDGKVVKNEDGTIKYVEQNKEISVVFYEDRVLEGIGIEKIAHRVGISPAMKFDFLYSLGYGFTGTWGSVVEVFNTLGLLFSSNQVGVNDLSGPVGIFSLIESSVNQGIVSYISLLAMLSVNIGIINLLPIPALDGGRLVFLAYEGITRKKPNKKIENGLTMVVFVLIMVLFVYITFNDILRLG